MIACEYMVTIIIFIPLFVVVMILLMRNFNELFTKVKMRASIFGTIFILVLIFRFLVYLILQFTVNTWLSVETIKGEIPFYVSEIFVSLCYMVFMISLYQKNKNELVNDDTEGNEEDFEQRGNVMNGRGKRDTTTSWG